MRSKKVIIIKNLWARGSETWAAGIYYKNLPLWMITQKVMSLKMAGQRAIVLEPLVVFALLFTNVTLVMLFVQMLVQKIDVVKPFRTAKFTDRMTIKSGPRTISVLHVILKLTSCKSGQLRNKVTLVIYA